MIRARVAESICARHIRSSKRVNDVLGTGAQIISGWRVYAVLSSSFAEVAGDRRSCSGLICKKVCPCARPGGSKVAAISSGKRRVAGRAANSTTRAEPVLCTVFAAQIAVQIALWAAAACYCRSRTLKAPISRGSQYGFSTDCTARFGTYRSCSSRVNRSDSTSSTLFSELASLCANRVPVSAGRASWGALCEPHMQKAVLPVLTDQ